MTAGDHEMPPHVARYLEAVSGASLTADANPSVTITPVYDVDQYLTNRAAPAAAGTRPKIPLPDSGEHTGAIQADGHVDPAAAARWHQAQTEMVGLIREENRASIDQPAAGRAPVLPDSLADWMETRVSQLERAEPEIG